MKFFGKIGYSTGPEQEVSPGIYDGNVVERSYFGDVSEYSQRTEESNKINDDIIINNTISVIADDYALNHLFEMIYVVWMGKKWKIKSIKGALPRINISIGGLYNGESRADSTDS